MRWTITEMKKSIILERRPVSLSTKIPLVQDCPASGELESQYCLIEEHFTAENSGVEKVKYQNKNLPAMDQQEICISVERP